MQVSTYTRNHLYTGQFIAIIKCGESSKIRKLVNRKKDTKKNIPTKKISKDN